MSERMNEWYLSVSYGCIFSEYEINSKTVCRVYKIRFIDSASNEIRPD